LVYGASATGLVPLESTYVPRGLQQDLQRNLVPCESQLALLTFLLLLLLLLLLLPQSPV
jgi:hypothetical protein